ncbi:MAG: RagB/SusD family nutrient uptake outer membrane protein, partial [Cytophagales bacterium]|nr:RagB/SusD family nutrient uptake outer membrane protein [Cytophagales bacterium]
MKSRIIRIIVTVALIATGTSCGDFLDVVPENIAEIEDAFKTRDSAERFLVTLYGYLPPYASINNPSLAAGDEIAVNEEASRNWPARTVALGGQSVVNPRLGYWGNKGTVSNLFIALRDCNIFLENIDKPFDLESFEKKRWIAEAKFLKAYYHFYLMRMYGPIPITRENITVGSGVDAVRVSRDPVDEVAEYIVALCNEAIPDLPLVIDDTGQELGRATSPVAAAIKARVLMTVASPLFNGNADYANFVNKDGKALINTTYDEAKWTRAVEACREAIDLAHGAGHSLYEFTDARADWSDTTVLKLSIRGSITERWNNEVIWGGSNSAGTTLQNWSQAKIAPGLTAETINSIRSWWSPPMRIAEMFYSENGVPIDEDVNYDYADRYKV